MLKTMLTLYLLENPSDIYYRRRSSPSEKVEQYVERIFYGHIRVVDAFDWMSFRNWALKNYKININVVVNEWYEYQENFNLDQKDVMEKLTSKFPEFFDERGLSSINKLDAENLL